VHMMFFGSRYEFISVTRPKTRKNCTSRVQKYHTSLLIFSEKKASISLFEKSRF
jgi:hypothetical protein